MLSAVYLQCASYICLEKTSTSKPTVFSLIPKACIQAAISAVFKSLQSQQRDKGYIILIRVRGKLNPALLLRIKQNRKAMRYVNWRGKLFTSKLFISGAKYQLSLLPRESKGNGKKANCRAVMGNTGMMCLR